MRLTALWAFGEIEAHDSVDMVAPALKDGDPAVRRMAAWALGEIESSAAVGPLTPLLRDPEDTVRRSRRGRSARSRAPPPCRLWRQCATTVRPRSGAPSDGPLAPSTTVDEVGPDRIDPIEAELLHPA